MNLENEITHINEDDFNALFEETPIKGQPKAEDLLGGKQKEDKKVKETKEEIPEEEEETEEEITEIEDLDELFEEKKKPVKKEKQPEAKSEEDIPDETEDSADQVNSVLKNTVDYLVKQGIWADWPERETAEIDEALYAEIAAKQDEFRVTKMFSELVDETGPYGKAIIEFVKDGGDPEQVIDIFKEQKKIENFSTESDEGKKALIHKYYKEVLNWKDERVSKHISTLVQNEDLEGEAQNLKELYEDYHEKELAKITRSQEQAKREQEAREVSFKKNITQAITERKDIPENTKKLLEKSILSYNNQLPNGQKVSDFYIRFAQMQNDPKEYVDFVLYVMDKENYLKKAKTEIKNEVADNTFNFVKGNTALTKKKGTFEDVQRDKEKVQEFSFGLPKKK